MFEICIYRTSSPSKASTGGVVYANHTYRCAASFSKACSVVFVTVPVSLLPDAVRLLEQGAHASDILGVTALVTQSRQGRLRPFEYLVQSGADIHYYNMNGSSLLHHAAFYGRGIILEGLYEVQYLPKSASVGDRQSLRTQAQRSCRSHWRQPQPPPTRFEALDPNLPRNDTVDKSMTDPCCPIRYVGEETGRPCRDAAHLQLQRLDLSVRFFGA